MFQALARREFEGFLAAITILNVNYFAEKERDHDFAIAEISKLLALVSICPITELTFLLAVSSELTDFEDAVQHQCAIDANLDAIVTRNKKDFKHFSIPVYSPSEFLDFLHQENKIAD